MCTRQYYLTHNNTPTDIQSLRIIEDIATRLIIPLCIDEHLVEVIMHALQSRVFPSIKFSFDIRESKRFLDNLIIVGKVLARWELHEVSREDPAAVRGVRVSDLYLDRVGGERTLF